MTRKILLADDSVTIQKVVELTFAEGDYQVQCVSNGKAAVQKIQEDRPDLLLCDVIMPEMNGYDVASFVKHNPTFSAIPVILLTGTFEPFDEEKARQSGADTFITKPFDSRMLVDKVEELLKRQVAFDSSANEVVQVFHSRTEFSLGEQPTAMQPSIPEAPFPAVVPEQVVMSAESEDGLSKGTEEGPFLRHEESVFEQDQTVQMSVSSLDLHQTPPDEGPVIEAIGGPPDTVPFVDIGSSGDDSIPEAAFSDIIAPEPLSVAAAEEDVVLSAEEVHEWPASESDLPSHGTEPQSVSGSEDWGAGQSISRAADAVLDVPESVEFLGEPSPNLPMFSEMPASEGVVHDLTEQQSMVAEAQQEFDRQLPAAGGPEMEIAPFSAEPPEPVTGAYEVPAQEPVPPIVEDPALVETPFLPDEGLEVGIGEAILPAVEVPEASLTPSPMDATQERESLPTPTDEILDKAVPEELVTQEAEAAATGGEPVGRAQAVPSAFLPDRAELEAMVREAVAGVLPALLAQRLPELARASVAGLLPVLARQHAVEALPGILEPLVREGVAGAVSQRVPAAVSDAVGGEVQRVLAEVVPDRVRQVTQEMAPGIISEETRGNLAQEIERAFQEAAPDIIRQVAWEVIPELAESLIKRRIQELESEPS